MLFFKRTYVIAGEKSLMMYLSLQKETQEESTGNLKGDYLGEECGGKGWEGGASV